MIETTVPIEMGSLVRDNRVNGHNCELWLAELLRTIYEDVKVVGQIRGGAIEDKYHAAASYDFICDSDIIEGKSCAYRNKSTHERSGTRWGRWKIDFHAHDAMEPYRRERMKYALMVRDKSRVLVVYLVSYAKMTTLIERFRKTGRNVSISHMSVGAELSAIYDVRRRRV